MAADKRFHIPTIRGRIAERLQRAPERSSHDEDELSFPSSPATVTLSTPEERGVVALACLILENLREHGGTLAPKDALENVLKKSLGSFGPKEVMDIEVEAYELLLWLGSAIDPSTEVAERDDSAEPDPSSSHLELCGWAIAGGHDLEMDYYSAGRGELTHRRITPISLEAETYLHAYCHMRKDERVFRLSRIGDLQPVGGWGRVRRGGGEDDGRDDTDQMSLLDDS